MTEPTAHEAPEHVIARMGLAKHGPPSELGDLFERVGKALRREGSVAEHRAALLAAQGWSSSTMGDGGPRSSDESTPIERHLGLAGPGDTVGTGTLDRWKGADARYAEALRDAEKAVARVESLHTDLMAHASDRDVVLAGTGECVVCGRFCRRTTARPEFRLKELLCPACYQAWTRAGRPSPRQDWERARRALLTDAGGAVHPEDDSDIDMSGIAAKGA